MGGGGIAPPFATSALGGGEWSALRLDLYNGLREIGRIEEILAINYFSEKVGKTSSALHFNGGFAREQYGN
jgi:hypothetical protein